MIFFYYLSQLKPIYRNKQWLKSGVSLATKTLMYPSIIETFIYQLYGKKRMFYLGNTFYYDNPFTPFNMMLYPYECKKRVLNFIDGHIQTVLDVGGNIGQFTLSLKYFCKDAVIDVFEPNPDAFQTLIKNLSTYTDTVNVFNYGLGQKSKSTKLYVEGAKSATGSLDRVNAGKGKGVRALDVKITNKPFKLTNRRSYDLIKIDVEGHEIEVIESLRGVSTRYLFIEVSTKFRSRSYNDSQLFSKIRETLGDYEVCYMSGLSKNSDIYELLLHFLDERRIK